MASRKGKARIEKGKQHSNDPNDAVKLDSTRKWGKRPNLFDAVAERVSSRGLEEDSSILSMGTRLAPEEVLFQSTKAPERTQEDDFYWADRDLKQDSLPDSDLLNVIHSFTSDYYHLSTADHGRTDTKSFDGSALLALGILLEETTANILGDTGDMAFVEGQEFHSTRKSDPERSRTRSHLRSIGLREHRRVSKKTRLSRLSSTALSDEEDNGHSR